MNEVTTSDSPCAFCGKSLVGEPFQPYEVRFGDTAFHIRCQDIYNGYRQIRSAHATWCHLPNCTQQPTNPFAEVTA